MCAAPAYLGHLPIVSSEALLDFPSADALLSAIRGQHVGVHRLCQLARELGRVCEAQLSTPDSLTLRRERSMLIDDIDVWVAQRLPTPHPNSSLHNEAMGAVIARLAAAQVRAYRLLMTVKPADDDRVHAEWTHLAVLVDGYTDLTTEVLARSRRLPPSGVAQ
ncbi:DUF4254 domain-containing protein [Nocardia uniformis]|uniref:DUF4254 domain-containing protein n=1 Tax=Nocardia uniformis TaxID=53432 RepID=A0A849CIF7_9NOCA|nr:DUF4254 domain-containing protein [Nocardia uniformis]NNH73681.1 DUF4254 domain-containing protein [Nocardia uniformis]